MRSRWKLLWLLLPLLLAAAVGGYFEGRRLWAESHYRAGIKAAARHQFDEALDHFDHCLQLRSDHAEANLAAAQAARRAGNFDRAERYLAEYQQLAGRTPARTLEWAALQVQRGQGDSDQEAYLWSQIDCGDVDPVPLLEALAQGYLSHYRLGEAMTCLERLLALDADNGLGFAMRAAVWQGTGFYDKAVADYRRALELTPENDAARCQLGDLLFFQGKAEEAAAQYEYVNERRPDNSASLLGLGLAERRLNRPDDARRHLDALLAQRPADPLGLRERGLLAMDADSYAEAETWLRKAEKADPFDQEICFSLAECLTKLDRTGEAKPFYERAAALDADFKALRALNKKIAANPADADLRYQVGRICYRNGQKGEALRWWTGALQVDPSHSDTHAALADWYAEQGQTQLAEEHRRLVRRKPSER